MKSKILKNFLLIIFIIVGLFIIVSCGKGGDSSGSINGTYYGYNIKTGLYDDDSWIMIDGSRWTNDEELSGTIEINENSFVIYLDEDGENIELLAGTIIDGVITIDDNTYYCLKGKKPINNINNDNNQNNPKQEVKKYTIVFDANGGEFKSGNYIEKEAQEGSKVSTPEYPTKKNQVFSGWVKDKDGNDFWDFSEDVVTNNITLYAKWKYKEAIILTVDDATIIDNKVFMLVNSNVEYISLATKIVTSNNSTWKLYYDRWGQVEIPTKIAVSSNGTLRDGDNLFYIAVTSSNGMQTNLYELNVYKSFEISIYYMHKNSTIHTETTFTGYEKNITYIPTIEGYSFNYWMKEDSETKSIIPYSNITLIANTNPNTDTKYIVRHYQQNIENDNYMLYEYEEKQGTTDSSTVAKAKTYKGFTANFFDQENILPNGETVVNIYYSRNYYTLELNSNMSDAGEIIEGESGRYKYGKELTISVSTQNGYTWLGWYEGDAKVNEGTNLSYTFTMGEENKTYVAKWSINKYSITLDNQAEGVTILGVDSGNEYEYNSQITISGLNIPNNSNIKWTRSDGIKYYGASYTFNMPPSNITITIGVVAYERDNNEIYFGSYPQTKINDKTLISSLNERAGDLPSKEKENNWTSYGYYINLAIDNYMWYIDIEYNEEKYRGVYFTSYRPIAISEISLTNQDDYGYNTNVVYWFKYEPIKWNILSEDDGEALILADLILDSQMYGSSNTYSSSRIRYWLNGSFYDTAFSELQKQLISTKEVNNSERSTNPNNDPTCYNGGKNKNACSNTQDKIFLLSVQEATKSGYGFGNSNTRKKESSDYAKAQGLYVNPYAIGKYSFWLLRSPDYHYNFNSYVINNNGEIKTLHVYSTEYGIVPALRIKLK